MGYVAAFIIAAATAAALKTLKIRFCLSACRGGAQARLCLNTLGIISINIKLQGNRRKHPKPSPAALKLGLKAFAQRASFLRLEKFNMRGSIGVANDAAMTALLCGAASTLLPKLAFWLLGRPQKCSAAIMPEFRFASAWIYMECIIRFNAAKLIIIIGKEVLNNVTSCGKHNAQHYGTAKADG